MTAIGTVATVVVALFVAFLSSIRRWYNRPRFGIELGNEEPFARRSNLLLGKNEDGSSRTIPSYWIRLRIRNEGRSVARSCEGKLVRITRLIDMRDRTDFDPVVLHWVGSTSNPRDINRLEYEYLDVVYTRADCADRIFIPAEEQDPRGINLAPPREDCILHIALYGANVEPMEKEFRLKNGTQYDQIQIELV